ncbi:MAG: allantoicase [Candidatus Sericytochromatia bacterium]|nr:allantoicase [Candidatus Sericytochromatia bacterium]
MHNVPEFVHLVDLAAEKVGGQALFANDEFFAEKENLLKEAQPVFIADKYTDRGKWMDGWESRRSRQSGHDWCLIKLGIPGVIHGFDVWTAHFKGNYPEHCALEACVAEDSATAEELLSDQTRWVTLVPHSRLQGDSHNYFSCNSTQRWTHLRLNIYPDGGVARLRVYGKASPDWSHLGENDVIELSALHSGGEVLLCNDMFFSPKENLILPTKAAHMGEGWETRRRREPGHDWAIVRLGATGKISAIEVDTAHFKGNYPDACSIDGCLLEEDVPADFMASRSIAWQEILPPVKLQADNLERFTSVLKNTAQSYSHIRLNIFPDGGISRLHIWGTPSRFARFNQRPQQQVRADLARCCGASKWLEGMLTHFPFASTRQVLNLAEQVADQLHEKDWLEAFTHHPKIGDMASLREKFAHTADLASNEQAGSLSASEDTLKALAEGNKAYEERFGFIFIVCATGRSAAEMLQLLQARLHNDRNTEIRIAAAEQRKITQLRLEQIL